VGDNFRKANLNGANLSRAILNGADLSDANLSDADLSGAKLGGAKNLDQRFLDGACGNERTKLPERRDEWTKLPQILTLKPYTN
jgi:uncharacterized protein YjbI with pentapeptide repeats